MKSSLTFIPFLWQKIKRNLKDRGLVNSFVHFKRQFSRRTKYRGLDLWRTIGKDLWGTTGQEDESRKPEEKKHYYRYEATKPFIFKEAFRNLDWHFNESTFIDFGCGKGAGLLYASDYRFKKLIGVEFSQQLCDIANENMKKFVLRSRHKIDYDIVHKDACEFEIPPESDCFYFFNPFDGTILEKVIRNILRSLETNKRKIIIVYINALHHEILKKYSFNEIKCVSAKSLDVYLGDFKICVYTNLPA
jgi:hypothetical protein